MRASHIPHLPVRSLSLCFCRCGTTKKVNCGVTAHSCQVYGDGDSAVNIESIQYTMKQWQGEENIYYYNVSGVTHFGMMSNQDVFQYIARVIGESLARSD